MGVAEEVELGLNFYYAIAEWQVTPMRSVRLVAYHHWWLVGDKHVNIAGNEAFGMVIPQSEEPYAPYLACLVLKEKHVWRQVFNRFGIPKAQVVIASYEEFMGMGKGDEPVKEVQSLCFRAPVGEVATMNQHVCRWQLLQ